MTPPFAVARTLPFPNGSLVGVAVADKLGRIFVSDRDNRKIWVVDRETFQVVAVFVLRGYARAPWQ